jgi:hypothetical protein
VSTPRDAVLAGSGGNHLSGRGNQVPVDRDAVSARGYLVQRQRWTRGDGVSARRYVLPGGGDAMPR